MIVNMQIANHSLSKHEYLSIETFFLNFKKLWPESSHMCKTNFWFELWISLFLALLCMIWHTECQIANGNMLSGAGKRDVLVKHVWSCSDGQDPFLPQLLLREWLYWELVSNSDKKWSKNYVSLIGHFHRERQKWKW